MPRMAVRTLAGVTEALDAANGGMNFSLTNWKLGNGVNYTPTSAHLDIEGAVQATGTITDVIELEGTRLQYIVQLPSTLGNFSFGEVGLYSSTGTLHYLFVLDALERKVATSGAIAGNTLTLKLPIDFAPNGSNITVETIVANVAKLAEVEGFDQLPPAMNPITNAYLVAENDLIQRTVAYASDSSELWRFSNYMRTTASAAINNRTNTSVRIPSVATIPIVDIGDIVIQISSGPARGLCRAVTSYSTSGGNITFNFADSMPNTANGNTIEVHTNINAWTRNELLADAGAYIPIVEKGVANGVATLGADARVPVAQLPVSSSAAVGAVRLADAALMTAGVDTGRVPPVSVVAGWANARFPLLSAVGAVSGIATLNASGVLTTAQIPPSAIQRPYRVANQAAMLALAANLGDVAIRTDEGKCYMLGAVPATTLANWYEMLTPVTSVPVSSVNGQTGAVVLTPAAIGAVPTTRAIATGTYLTGGGDLSADRTIGVDLSALITGLDPTFVTHAELTAFNGGTVTPERSTAIDAALIDWQTKWGGRAGNFSTSSLNGNVTFTTPYPEGAVVQVTFSPNLNTNDGHESDRFWIVSVSNVGFTWGSSQVGHRNQPNMRWIAQRAA